MTSAAATTKFTILAATIASFLCAASARAETITIEMAEDGFNGGNGVGAYVTKATSINTGMAMVLTGYGTFTFNTVTALGISVLNDPELLLTNATDTANNASGTHTLHIRVTESGLLGNGTLDTSSGFTTNVLRAGFTVTETTYVNGVALNSHDFNNVGTTNGATSVVVNGAYTLAEIYDITATGSGSANSTIDLSGMIRVSETVPAPLPATLPLFAGALGGGFLFRQLRRKQRS